MSICTRVFWLFLVFKDKGKKNIDRYNNRRLLKAPDEKDIIKGQKLHCYNKRK